MLEFSFHYLGTKVNNNHWKVSPLWRTIAAVMFSIILVTAAQNGASTSQSYASFQPNAESTQPIQGASAGICDPNSPVLRLQSSGPKVEELQRYLTQLGYGYLLGQDGTDGKFGRFTENAVKTLQNENGLDLVDGVVGPRTWEVICRLVTSSTAVPPAQQQPPAQEGPAKPIPSGQTKPVYNKNGVLLGYAGYGGGSLENALFQLKANGNIGITDEQIAVLKGVASVETGGQLQSVNTWDSAVVSFGFMQWTLRYGEFQRLIERASSAFKEYGIELGGQYKFGKDKPVPGILGVSDPKNLRFGNWPDRFFAAGKDPRIVEVETEMAIAELNAFTKKLQDIFGVGLSAYFKSPVTVSLLFELNNNRPAYVNKVVLDALQQTKGQTLNDSDFINILRKEIINEYLIRENDGSKGQRLADKIINTLGVRT